MALQLQTYAGDFRALKATATAALAGVTLDVVDVDAKKQSPNTVPVLVTPQGNLTQSNAIARYIARSRPEAGLMGNTFFQSGQVESWIDWGTNNAEIPAIMLTYWQYGWIDFNFQANKKALEDMKAGFEHLEKHLISRTYLVGNRITLADVIVAAQLFGPLKLSLDGKFRSQFPSVMRWFEHIAETGPVKQAFGALSLCKVAPSPPKKQKQPKKQKKKNEGGAKKAAAPAPAPKPKKKAKNPLDLLPKSPFVLDDWKRTYSNSTSDYFKSMEYFWKNFDNEGWSLWLQEFNHNDENTTDFIVCNKMEGYVQRTIGIQKYAFGCMQMLDSMEKLGYYTVAGIWLIRGQKIEPMLDVNPESSVYTWSRLDTEDEATRKRIGQYWCGEHDIDGYDCYDAKIFK